MDIIIRQPEAHEWQAYKELRLKSLQEFPLAFSSSYEESLNKPDEDWVKQINAGINLEESLLLCAYDSGLMIGCVGAYWKNKSKTKHIANVGLMYVKPDYQGKKLGEKLLEELIGKLKAMNQFRKIQLEVVTENIPAANLYRKIGFRDTGIKHEELYIEGKYYDTTLMEMSVSN